MLLLLQQEVLVGLPLLRSSPSVGRRRPIRRGEVGEQARVVCLWDLVALGLLGLLAARVHDEARLLDAGGLCPRARRVETRLQTERLCLVR